MQKKMPKKWTSRDLVIVLRLSAMTGFGWYWRVMRPDERDALDIGYEPTVAKAADAAHRTLKRLVRAHNGAR